MGDPFSGEPLSYTDDGIERLIVHTEPLRRTVSILNEIGVPTLNRRYYVIGQRGMGKSTLLNFIIRTLLRSVSIRKVLPVFVNTVTEGKDPESLRLNFVTSTIESLFQVILMDLKRSGYLNEEVLSKFARLRRNYFDQKGSAKIDSRTAEEFLYHLLAMLNDFGIKQFLLLYDELDKIDSYTIVLEFIRKSQSLMENLVGKYGCTVFISGIPDWISLLSKDEYSGVRGESISLEPWLPEDAMKLINLRLKYSTYGKFETPFSDEAVKEICERGQGRPRRILELAKALLIWGAGQKKRYFEKDFCAKIFWRDDSVTRFYDALSSEDVLLSGYNKLKRIYDPDKDDPAAYYLLTLIYSVEKYADLPLSELRKRYGIDMDELVYKSLLTRLEAVDAIKRSVEAFPYYSVTKELKGLFQYVTRTLAESLEYLPQVIKMHKPGIAEIVEEFSLRQECIAVLSNAPAKTFHVNNIVKAILENPDARQRAGRFYSAEGKELSEDELSTRLKIGMRAVLRKLTDEGYVLRQQKGRRLVYRWFPKYIDVSGFKDLPVDEGVIKDLEAAGQNFGSGLYDPAISNCRSAVENALRVLYKTVKKQPCPRNWVLDNLNQFFLDNKVYDRGLHSLILGFCQQTNPVVHREVVGVQEETARVLLDLAQNIVKQIFKIRRDSSNLPISSSDA